ncbi:MULTISPECIES: hypothetical protein [Streptomyces]|uniref:hypothetical protein n=1 Tax=Streptomyces TaxID=1883 RepID=UPI002256AEAC|nr:MULTISPECIES: hypothetical protein [Streptomyces]MCX4705636.1 hypothetical protein [Streptomyces sp. NBC_01373]
MDAATLSAIGVIVVGLAAAAAALVGHRGANSANHSGVVISGSLGLVNELQEERKELQTKLTANEVKLAAAYADLARESAAKAEIQSEKARLQGEIALLSAENASLRARIVELGGQHT